MSQNIIEQIKVQLWKTELLTKDSKSKCSLLGNSDSSTISVIGKGFLMSKCM